MQNNSTNLNSGLNSGKALRSIVIGSALLAATTNVGPGFCTQTSLFSYQYLGGMLLAIILSAIFDSVMQTTTYRMCCFAGKEAQGIADDLKKGLGAFLSCIVIFGLCCFQLGNVGGIALGLRTLLNIQNTSVSVLLGGVCAIAVFAFKKFNNIIDMISKLLAVVMIVSIAIVAVMAKPSVSKIFETMGEVKKISLLYPVMTMVGAVSGGYASLIGPHRLLGRGIKGKEHWKTYRATLAGHLGTVYLIRVLFFLACFGVVAHGMQIDTSDPARSIFQTGAGMFGYYLMGVVLFAAGVTTVIGAAVTLVSMIRNYFPKVAEKERETCIVFIAIATILMAVIGQPAAMLVAASSINGMVLPVLMVIMLIASRSKRVMGAEYHHPIVLTVIGVIMAVMFGYSAVTNFSQVVSLFR